MTPSTTAVGFIQSLNTFFSLFWRIISSHRHTSVKPTFLLLHFSFQVNSQQQQTLCELSFPKEGTPAFQYSRESSGGRTTSTDYFEKWVHGNFISQNHRLSLKHYQGHVQTFNGSNFMEFLRAYGVVTHQTQEMPRIQLIKTKSSVSRLESAFLFCILSTERYRTETPLYKKQYISLDKSNSRCTCLYQPRTPFFGLLQLCHNITQ